MAMRAKKTQRHSLLVPYQTQLLSRPGGGIGIGLPGLYSHALSRRALPAGIGINPGGNDMLACRQIATVISALSKASHILAINRHDKAEIAPEVCDPSYDHMT